MIGRVFFYLAARSMRFARRAARRVRYGLPCLPSRAETIRSALHELGQNFDAGVIDEDAFELAEERLLRRLRTAAR